MFDTILAKYGEIVLKGENKGFFEKRLAENIKRMFKKNGIKYVEIKRYRAYLAINAKGKEEKIRDVLKNVFGIANFSFAYSCEKDIEKIKKLVMEKSGILKNRKSFKVEASRQDKSFKHKSMDIGRIIGEAIYNKYKIKGDMENPDATVYVEIADKAYVYFEKTEGLRNLPIGSCGKTLCLLSGGIDSSVAAWLMMKRGCYVTYLHFYNSKKDIQKIKKLLSVLNRYQGSCKLYLVPFDYFQIAEANVFPNYEMILFRRHMLKIAQSIAEKEHAKAITLGDNLGQVASQTMENLAAFEYNNAKMLIIRPLITYSKQEIIDLAKKIGTYDISILPQKDCCSMISKHPSTRPNLEKLERMEKESNTGKLVEKTLKNIESMIVD